MVAARKGTLKAVADKESLGKKTDFQVRNDAVSTAAVIQRREQRERLIFRFVTTPFQLQRLYNVVDKYRLRNKTDYQVRNDAVSTAAVTLCVD
jgi:hypothetical protein